MKFDVAGYVLAPHLQTARMGGTRQRIRSGEDNNENVQPIVSSSVDAPQVLQINTPN